MEDLRTTVEIDDAHRAELLKLAAQRGEKGFSSLIREALDLYVRQHRARREAVSKAMTILPFGPEEAKVAAEVRQQVESQGQPIGMADYMIAATCISNDGILLTRNLKHFERVKGLRLAGA